MFNVSQGFSGMQKSMAKEGEVEGDDEDMAVAAEVGSSRRR